MTEEDEAVLVKAHLRRKQKRRRVLNEWDFVSFLVIFGAFATAFFFFYNWVKAGGWVILVGSILGICTIYGIIRWRHLIFRRDVWTAIRIRNNSWGKIKEDSYPLWLLARYYELKYRRHMRRKEYIINGSVWQYRVTPRYADIKEPHAKVRDLTIYKRKVR